jgi:manganese/zinc/iron transport system substrate-binding protein
LLAFIVLLPASTSSCGDEEQESGKPGPASSDRPLVVVCTIGMITDVVRQIGGDAVTVTGLMGEHVDPHTYKATPSDHRLLRGADLVFYSGLHLEGRMVETLEALAEKQPVVAVAETIDQRALRQPSEFAGNYDPHVWFDVALWLNAAERIRDALIRQQPRRKDLFTGNAEAYLTQLADLHEYCRTRLQGIPPPRRVLVTAHDAFGYFGRAYGLEVLAIQGLSTESEAGVKKINELVDAMIERRIPAVFVESSVSPRLVEALIQGCESRGHRVKVGGELFSDAMGAEGTPEGTYIGMVRHNVDTIVEALK